MMILVNYGNIDVDISSNIIGDPITNAGFCGLNVYPHSDTTADDVVCNNVFNLNNDKCEKNNFETLKKPGDDKNLEKILKQKLNYYANSTRNGSQSGKFFYYDEACFNAAKWVAFKTDDEAADSIKVVRDDISEEHIFKLVTTTFEFPDIVNKHSKENKPFLIILQTILRQSKHLLNGKYVFNNLLLTFIIVYILASIEHFVRLVMCCFGVRVDLVVN